MMARLHRLRRDCRGAAAMELVLIAPVVAGILYAALDFSKAWMMRLNLEQAAQGAMSAAVAQRGVQTSYDYVLAEARAAYGQPLRTATLDNWLECDGVRQGSLTANCNGAQRARYVSILLTAEYVPAFGWGVFFNGSTANNGFIVGGDATVRLQ